VGGERTGLLVSFAALALWALTALPMILGGFGFMMIAGGWMPVVGDAWVPIAWLLFPIPFAFYVLIYALRRWTADV
jgi:hypothetical protein